jgi:DUF4097 and DUF4098 domain-containing protein YvlB
MHAPWRIAVLAVLALALPAQAQHRHHHSSSDDDAVLTRLDTTVTIEKSATIDLQGFSGDITVTGWDRDQVKVHAVTMSRLRFDSSPSRVTLVESPVDGDYDNDEHTGFEISMPRSGRLLLRTMSGDVEVHDVSDVEAHSVSGDVDVTNVASHAVVESVSGDVKVMHVSGGARLNSVSGSIEAKTVTGEVAAQSVSGDITLDDVTSAFVRTETVSGDSRFTGPVDPKGRYEFHSHSGDVDVDLTGGGADATLEMETYSGDLDTACKMTLQPGGNGDRMGKRGTFTLGHGGGAHFILKTFSGDVHISGCRSHGDN